MTRRSALSVVSGLLGIFGHALSTRRAFAEEREEIPPADIVFQTDQAHEIGRIHMDGTMNLNLQELTQIIVKYNGKTKTISPKELFEAL